MDNTVGIILKAIAGFYYIDVGNDIYECKARGIFKKDGISPTVGDKVEITDIDGLKGIVDKIFKRKNLLIRPPIANIDRLFIISSHDTPPPNALIIDRLTAICEDSNIEPVIIFNKSDLGSMDNWCDLYKKAHFTAIATSAKTGEGIKEIRDLLKGKVSAFTGNSGVGKSSILNAVLPELQLKVGEVSKKLGRGRHTTRHVELFPICGGYVADTPGFSSLDIEKTMVLLKEDLPYLFPEFNKYIGKCKFSSCTHTVEKGCEIIKNTQNGNIAKSRFESYCSIYNEIKDLHKWEMK